MVLPVQNPESPYVTLKIDQGEGFSFAIDKVDEFQSDIKLMSVWAEDATAQMKQRIDKKLLAFLADLGDAGVTVSGNPLTNTTGLLINGATTAFGSTVALGTGAAATKSVDTGDEIIDKILLYGQYLDENNAPDEGRFVVMPAWAMQLLKGTNSKLSQVYWTGDSKSPMRNGQVGSIDRFTLYSSNNLAAASEGGGSTSVIFGQKAALTFATQITENRIIDNPFSFGKMMQGLQVYGLQIIKPQFLGLDYIRKGA